MKRCPTCKQTFTDPGLSFCLDDGTPLIQVSEEDVERNAVGSSQDSSWNPPPYQPPSYVPPGGAAQPRKTWPWVIGIIGVVVVALVGIGVAAVIFLPRLAKRSAPIVVSSNEHNANRSDNSTKNDNANVPANQNLNESTNTSNANTDRAGETPPPTDKSLVLTQLTELEQDWTAANLNADKKKLDQILADDYVGPTADGKMQGKVEYLNTIERDTTIQKWEFRDLRLMLRGDRATLMGKIDYFVQDRTATFSFVDRFVWREGRWQATGSEVTPLQQQ